MKNAIYNTGLEAEGVRIAIRQLIQRVPESYVRWDYNMTVLFNCSLRNAVAKMDSPRTSAKELRVAHDGLKTFYESSK